MITSRPISLPKISASNKKKVVVQYFDAISERYDLADTLMSFGLNFLWRRAALKHLAAKNGYRVLDLCGGAGEFARRIAGTGTSGMTVVCDLSRAMLAAGKRGTAQKTSDYPIQWVRSDAEQLGFAEKSFNAVIVGYGIRNLSDLSRGLQEIQRVLVPGGKLVIMEFSIPRSRWLRALYHWYSFRVMPGFGRLITGEAAPFVYLAESIQKFPPPKKVQEMIASAGFMRVTFEPLSNGLVTVYSATRQACVFTTK
jgi:demethylmenaquinone methyltransferase / 2-methoxy-6-polyprenyl-1,4-benzoquinol methylase